MNHQTTQIIPSVFDEDCSPALSLNDCTIYVPFAAAIDCSGSMDSRMANGRTRYENAVDQLEQFLLKLGKNETMAENVHLFLYAFGGDTVTSVVAGEPLCDVDVGRICQELRMRPCLGRTPMGRTIVQVLDKLEEVKRTVGMNATNYAQPILTVIGDGVPTDGMDEARARINQAMQQDQQKLLFLPLGIGDEGTRFEIFEMLLEHDKLETPVVKDAEGLRAYFKLLNKTIREIEQGQYITPATHFGQIRSIMGNDPSQQAARREDDF